MVADLNPGANMDSILLSMKKMLGMEPDYTHFDTDVIININSIFMHLQQLGVGPKEGFSIKGNEQIWGDFVEEGDLEAAKTFMYLKLRLLFDPPSNAFLVDSMVRQVSEIEWRLNVQAEGGMSDEK